MMLHNRNTPQEIQGSSNRTFGLFFAAFFFMAGLWPVAHGAPPKPLLLGASGVLLFFSIFWPAALALPNRVWTSFGMLLHSVTSPIALGIMFYGLFTPMGLFMRFFGKDPLRLKFDKQAKSYWIHRIPPGPAPNSLHDQF